MWSKNIVDPGGAKGRRCGSPGSRSGRKCLIENNIFTRMQNMAIFCCKTYWVGWIVNDPQKCHEKQLAYWLWLPGNLASGQTFSSPAHHLQELGRFLDTFDPLLQPNLNLRAHMCNCGYDGFDNKDPTVCTHQLQEEGVHPANAEVTSATFHHPFMTWPTISSK